MKDIFKDPRYIRVKKSLLKQKEILAKHGVDISKQWAEMQKSVTKQG